MTRHRLEVADVIRSYEPTFLAEYGNSSSREQRRVLRAIAKCRTAALGGHAEECDGCGHRRIAYNSCRNRHCPKCQAGSRSAWIERRLAELLPVQYFHVVFTLPDALGPLALQNPRQVYGILFRAVAQTLLQIAADPKHLGAQIGFLAILHTWGQNLTHHPHVLCVVPGCGFAADGSRWINCRKDFFLPVRVLSRVFRGKFIALLKRAHRRGILGFHGRLKLLAIPGAFEAWLDSAVRTDWVVYAKRPFGGPTQVLKYLARYTHRVAISNDRLISLDNGQVRFHWKDYSQGNAQKVMTLPATEFLRRFLLHVLPAGFVKIRHCGFLGNRVREEKLARARQLLGNEALAPPDSDRSDNRISDASRHELAGDRCPVCKSGRMIITEWLLPQRFAPSSAVLQNSATWDTS